MNAGQTVFVVGEKSEIWWFPALFTAFLLIGVYVLFRYRRRGGTPLVMVGGGFALIGLLGPVLAISTWHKTHRYVEALRTSNFEVVAGKVTNFHPMPKEGHSLESFQVENAHFSYSDYNVSYCFNTTTSHGGPIREGLEVRISYIDNCILKLEVLPSR